MIRQGHRYNYEGHSVIAMESACRGLVPVRRIHPADPLAWMGPRIDLPSEKLVPEPMKYFRGETA